MSVGDWWRPTAAYAAHDDSERVASRDAGWAELLSADGHTRLGRGHLMVWAAEAGVVADPAAPASDASVEEDAVQPLGDSAPDLHAELRSFAPESDLPSVGLDCLVAPEGEEGRYSVIVREVNAGEPGEKSVIALDWPDDELPATLRELGGY